ncbi:MAG: CPBP family intramembrane metalloprotease [Clostridium sp.]|nr:CPBP family intramembrane metalloprotease [Clostridium sp.]
MRKIFKMDEQYSENMKAFNRGEGISALFLFAVICLGYAVFGYLAEYIDGNMEIYIGIIFNTVISAITIIFVKMNKRNITSIGIKSGKQGLSIAIGGMLAGILFYNNGLSYLFSGSRFVPIKEIILLIVFYFSVAVCEEFVFRGYIGTRIYSLVKYKSVAVILTGILFVFMHYPYRMFAYGMTLSDFFGNVSWIIDLFVTHIVFNLIYMKTNSLYGAIIPHWVSNLAYNIIDR